MQIIDFILGEIRLRSKVKGQGQTLKFHCLCPNSSNIGQNFIKLDTKVKLDWTINLLDFGPFMIKVKAYLKV